jgi:hypothetical protein
LSAVDGALDQAGATAQTGGFVDAAPTSHGVSDHFSSQQAPNSGGLGSSVNVQAIAREAQLAHHTKGMTKEDYLKRLSGREQAAAQLAAAQGFVPFEGLNPDSTPSVPRNTVGARPVESTGSSTASTQLQPSGQTEPTGAIAVSDVALISPQAAATTGPAIVVPVIVPAAVIAPTVAFGHDALEQARSSNQPVLPFKGSVAERPKESSILAGNAPSSQPSLPELLPSRYVPADTPMVEGLPGGWMGTQGRISGD